MANQRNRRPKPTATVTSSDRGEQRDRSEHRTAAIQQRREDRLRAFARQRRRRQIGKVVLSAIVVLLLAGTIYAVASRRSPSGTAAPAGVQTFTNLDRTHVDGTVTYAQRPPVGGKHNGVWQNCGFYSQPVANEHAVHSLEHGAVWIAYQPNLPEDQVQILKNLTNDHRYVLVSPYPNLPVPVVASAWGKQLRMTSVSDPRLNQFVRAFEQGPQTPEHGAPCSGGTSATT